MKQSAVKEPGSRSHDEQPDVCARCGASRTGAARPPPDRRTSGSSAIRAGFSLFARTIARWSGRPAAFGASVLVVLVWAATGPLFQYSDTWQLVINTSTTIITFWMVFVIQHTQNRDTEAMQLKLDEIIRVTQGAHNALIDLEDADDEELEAYRRRFASAAAAARAGVDRDAPDTADGGSREDDDAP